MHRITTRQQRKKRISNHVHGTSDRPRLSIFRSNAAIYAQIIDDSAKKTIVGASTAQVQEAKGTKTEKAKALGTLIAQKAKEQKVTKVVFDKGAYKYHGRVKALAEGAREGGLQF